VRPCDKVLQQKDKRGVKVNSGKLPKWSTPERREYLVKLWTKYGNQCLFGHTACPIPEHYQHVESKLVNEAYAQSFKCINTQGLPLKDSNGNQLYVTVYPVRKVIENRMETNRLYDVKSEAQIKYWIDNDRERDRYEWEFEREALHRTSDRQLPLRGQFSGISRDIWHDTQPFFYLEKLGISGLTFKPFAKLRLASSGTRLYVDISDVLKPLSKNAKRKAVRYAKSNNALQNDIYSLCSIAVKRYI
jgi:hypothetical protein